MDHAITPIRITIRHAAEVSAVGDRVRQAAAAMGHDGRAADEIALAGVELATNIVKYAGSGSIAVRGLADGDRRGIQIDAVDQGPGIRDFEEALVDGFSTSGSLGYGLGTVHRMMDDLERAAGESGPGGTHIVSRRWVRNGPAKSMPLPLDIGAATRPHPGLKTNGDAFVIKKWDHHALVGVIDGLGHGQYAHMASKKALQYVESHYDLPLEDLFKGVQRSCRATRGVVMSLALLALPESAFYYASVGNIEARVINAAEPVRFQIRRGIIGKNAPRPKVTRHPWHAGQMLILHSDGISSRWQWRDFVNIAHHSATEISHQLMRKCGKENDDATVVVVKGRKEGG